ncbi:MAG: branched-chain amino acid transferase [Thiotrichales bacterium]|nr:branched-chain amino acid transferase [Thiotrichales bacterium]|tara:strand:- start:1198 stop:2112 length:915 start_codon:yes stop_codon:yes gene_type:complete
MTEPNLSGVGFMDGRYRPRGELCLPITDLGFLLSDMAYDALHVRNGSFFRLQDHLDRFERSIARRRYTNFPHGRDEMCEILFECVRRSGLRDAMVMMVATRGDQVGYSKDLRLCKNRFMAWSSPYYGVVSNDEMTNGTSITVSGVQRIPPESVDPTVKNFARLDFCEALWDAYDKDCTHAVLVDDEGHLTEGRGWNLFVYRNGEIVTPQAGVLEGITRATVIELARRGNIDARLALIDENDLRSADEVFITSSAGGIIPVIRVDDIPVGDGSPGPVTERLQDLYRAAHDDPRYATPIEYDKELI